MRAGWVFALATVFMTIGCDRVTKRLATGKLAYEPVQSYFADTVRLEYAENSGAFLSVGSRLPNWARVAVFRIGVTAVLAAIIFFALEQRWAGTSLVGAALVFAGGVSNLIDRFLQGHVVDFLSVGIGPLRTGIFNVADVAIVAGAVMIVAASLVVNAKPRTER
jgi:signal peptidase II